MTILTLPDQDYRRFRDLVQSRTGLFFRERQRDMVVKAISNGFVRAKLSHPEAYYQQLQAAATNSPIWDDLVVFLTVGETYFFRNPSHITALREKVLPELIDKHRHHRRLRLWSAGCSSGEEPYTLAILLHELIPDISAWNLFILGTDINKPALDRARQGTYRPWSFRQPAPVLQERYFRQEGETFQIHPEIQQMVTFNYLNLAENHYPSLETNTHAMGLILCRNVTIYLPEELTHEIAVRFHQSLAPEGYLIMGASETNTKIFHQFASINTTGATLYQKPPAHPFRVTPKTTLTPPPSSTTITTSPPSRSATSLPQRSASDYYQRGLIASRVKRYNQAVKDFETVLRIDPEFKQLHYQLAQVYANQGQLKKASHHCQLAIQQDPMHVEAHYTQGLISQGQGKREQAIQDLNKALYLDPRFILAHFNLINLYQASGRHNKAAQHRRQVIRLVSKLPPNDAIPGSTNLTAGQVLTMLKIME